MLVVLVAALPWSAGGGAAAAGLVAGGLVAGGLSRRVHRLVQARTSRQYQRRSAQALPPSGTN